MSHDLEAGGHRAITLDGVMYINLADAAVTFSLYRKDIAAKDAEIARLRAWRETINDRLTTWMHPILDGEEPHDALMRLLDFERRAFCDPAVSQDAADLVATARREGMKDAARWHEVRSMELSAKAGSARNFRQLLWQSDFHMESAAAIRAAGKEGKP